MKRYGAGNAMPVIPIPKIPVTYGVELVLDLWYCRTPFNRKALRRFFKELCAILDMKREDLHFWDYKGHKAEYNKAPAHLKGTSAIQFIRTSNITVHTLDKTQKVFINIFSCKAYDTDKAADFCRRFFRGVIYSRSTIIRA